MIAPTTYTYKTVGDCVIRADVYRSSHGDTPAPAIVFMHGGCLMYGSRRDVNLWHVEVCQSEGYTFVSIDYRLAPETKLPGIIADLEDAFEWVRRTGPELFSVDPERIAAIGASAGGYLALMSGCRVAPRPKAIVSLYGYGDIVGDWYSRPDPFYCRQPAVTEDESGRHVKGRATSEPYEGRGKDKLYLFCRQKGLWPLEVGGRDPHEDPSFFEPFCPVRNVGPDYPPTLLLHGDRDTDVPYEQSVLMAEALRQHQVEHELITMRGLGHGFDWNADDPQVKDALSRALAFIRRHI